MARYKPIDTSPRFLAVDLHKQLLPGSLAHAVDHLLLIYPVSMRAIETMPLAPAPIRRACCSR